MPLRHVLVLVGLLALVPLLPEWEGQVRASPQIRNPKSEIRNPKSPDLATARIVDLTYSFDEKTIYWPTAPSTFELKKLAYGETPAGYFYSSYSFCTPEHGGTHLDAPIHFAKDGRTADQIPVRQLIAPAVVIDVSKKAERDPDYRASVEDVRAFEKAHGTIVPGTIVLLRTGWGKRWPDRKRYLGDDTPGDASRLHFPSYGKEAAELLVRDRRVGHGATPRRAARPRWAWTPPRLTTAPRRISLCTRSPWAPRCRAWRTSRTWRRSPRPAPG